MQEELPQFKLQQVWTLVDLPHGKRAIGTKWVYMNKKDKRGIVIRNKARLVAQGYTQEEGIILDEVFSPVARLNIRIEEEVYVCQPPRFEDPEFPDRRSDRRHLQLADADVISSLTTTKIFEQLSLMGSPTQTPIADEAASTSVDVRYGGATTTVTSLEVGQGSGNIDKTPTMPHDSPLPIVNTLGSDEGSMIQQELMVFCTTLSKKVESLETDLKQTKQIYGVAYTRLIKKDPSKQGRKIDEIDQDPSILLVQYNAAIQGRYRHDMDFEFDFDTAKEVSSAKKDVSIVEPVSTVGTVVTTASFVVNTVSPTRRVSTADDITGVGHYYG
ncbi:putative ribonuclease H-like domain-containing protein [Tanacetum coccineum]|uniref:Ribonuclease H-like domain-containing protein n=1 Tax=Tanacetum coccineum TaxID=301880 RepID=A0ABQ5BV00_9ASTR